MKPSEVIRKAREHIVDPAMWYKGGWSQSGTVMGARRGEPCCGYGAIAWASVGSLRFEAEDYLQRAARLRGHSEFPIFNDHPATTHADVLAAMDNAARMAEEAGE